MPVPDFAHGVTSSSYWMSHLNSVQTKAADASTASTASATTKVASAASGDSGESFFDNVLDIVNPLQHLPVVGTVYRAITGDKIGDVEKVAGDALYGGPIGLVSSLADLAFEKITGKDFGDTVMAWAGVGHSDTAVADNTIAPVTPTASKFVAANGVATPAAPATTPVVTVSAAKPIVPQPNHPVAIDDATDALLISLARNGVSSDMQLRAMSAYQQTLKMNAGAEAN